MTRAAAHGVSRGAITMAPTSAPDISGPAHQERHRDGGDRRQDIARRVPCGPDVAAHVEAVTAFADAGFTHVALVHIGGDAHGASFDRGGAELLPARRSIG